MEKLLEIGADHSREGTSVGETCPAADPEKATPRKVSDVLAESGSSGRRASSVSLKVVPAKIGTPRTPSRALTSVDRRTPARSISTPRTTTRTGKSVATPTAAVVIDASAETALKAFTKENQPSLNTPEDKPKSGNLIKGTIPPASISQLPVTKRAKVTVTLGKTASDVKPPSAITLSGGKASSAVPPTTAPVKKKFDLKESLRRPLNYKPHTGKRERTWWWRRLLILSLLGPLKPFSLL